LRTPPAELIGRSGALDAVRAQVRRLAQISEGSRLPPVLLLGETGTGKGMVASLLHRTGRRAAGPFIDVNCAAIPDTLLESELFGFERGAFTDARASKPGLFEAAHRGTLFLDEIGELPDGLQVKLLTAIESRRVRRLGSTRSEPVDVWIIAATSKDLFAAIRAGRFRQELYHRLATVVLELPPLRARDRDVLDLATHFLARAAVEHGVPVKALADDARAALLAYSWPGNVRELANVLERVMLLEERPVITAAMLSLAGQGAGAASRTAPVLPRSRDALRAEERQRLVAALDASRWNITRAAARLGMHRNTLRYRLGKHRISPDGGTITEEADRPAVVGVLPSSPPPAAKTIRWEERLVAVLSVTIAEPGAEDLTDLVETLTSFGAQIEQIAPSELVAVFGIEPMEDAARRAVLAAEAMRQTLLRSEAKKHARFAVHVAAYLIARAGAVTGLAAAARREAAAIVNGLLQRAASDEIVVDAAAARFLDRDFMLESVHDSASGTFRVLGRWRFAFQVGGRTLSPFVGRAREVATIHARMAAAEAGTTHIVGLVGEPGIGKSRLVFELTQSDRVNRWLVLETGAASHAVATRYRPVVDLMRSYFRIADDDTPRDIQEKVTGRVLTLDRTLEPTLPAFFALLEFGFSDRGWQRLDPAQRRQRTLHAITRLLDRESRIRPVLLIFEDLHWVDSETQALLDAVDGMSSARLLLLASFRPEYAHAWASKSSYTQLRLDSLAPESADELLDVLLGGDVALEPLKQLLATTTGRNPFFIEESVRTLVETRTLAGERGAYRLVRPVDAIEVPATVHAVLAARIDRLPAEDKRLLEVASVIGKDVPFVLLSAIADMSEAELRQRIVRLQAAEFFYETRPFPDVEYTFKHALTHEVAYGGVLAQRRRAIHRRLAEAIEDCYADRLAEHIDRLAHHSLKGERWEPAVRYLRQVGVRALDRSALREAASRLEEALGALQRLPETRATLGTAVDIRFELRQALNQLGDLPRVLTIMREAEQIADKLGDDRRRGEVHTAMVNTHNLRSELDAAVESGVRALAIADTLDDRGLCVAATTNLEQTYFYRGEYQRVVDLTTSNIRRLDTNLGETVVRASAPAPVYNRLWLVRSLAQQGRFAETMEPVETMLTRAEQTHHPLARGLAHFAAGTVDMWKGDWSAARVRLERAVQLLEEGQQILQLSYVIGPLAWTLAALGRPEDAAVRAEDAERRLDLVRSLGRKGGGAETCIALAQCYLILERIEDADRMASRIAEDGTVASKTHALRLQAEIAVHPSRWQPGTAEDCYRRALSLAEQGDMRPLVAHCHFGLGKLSRRTAERSAALGYLTTAATMYREMGMTSWLELAERELSEAR
jgi:transcriptional regulator with AAA-type ATPase domain/tetratricopeptide (TPR) repeat protein